MAKFDQIANALSGFGAGVAGRGSEFIAGIDNRKKMLSEERKTAAAKDLYKAHLMLDREIKNANAGGGPINLGPLNAFAETRVGAINKLGGDPSDTIAEMASINNDPLAALEAQRQALMMAQSQGYIALPANFGPAKPTEFQQNISGLSPEDQQAALMVKAGLGPGKLSDKQREAEDYLPNGVSWGSATRAQKQAASRSVRNSTLPSTTAPPDLLVGLTPEQARKGKAAFETAGGGQAGIAALNKAAGQEQARARLADLPNLLTSKFPKTTVEERREIDGAVASAKSAEEGLSLAAEVRETQRRLAKAKPFQIRAIGLLERILKDKNLPDVIGSMEGDPGSWTHMFDDDETSLIADIEEVESIMTADNLSLLSGVLSDSDLLLLKALSAGGLNRMRSEPNFRKDVKGMLGKLKSEMVKTVNDKEEFTLGPDETVMKDASGNRAIVNMKTNTVVREL